ncbi:hypothetical protein AN958_08393 [Leucoagaricus sp. SymC.cos]|nr:hypothetical protein AN958_08393 [Leucoagaricus sp. SymC.cos]
MLTSHVSGFFKNASHLLFWRTQMTDESVIGTHNVRSNIVGNNNVVHFGENRSIERLADHSIPGVEHDSSERDPPPQCHPGTRLDICGQAQLWFHDPKRKESLLWVHGPAGVGKSAIMQTLAQEESRSPTSILGATIFFSRLRQRNDPKMLFNTIAYQLAVRYETYRQYIADILTKDPKIVEKSMKEQFKWFIMKPLAEQNVLREYCTTVLIILDGLDEAEGIEAQQLLVSLIGCFSLDYPTSPLIWAITSRPEPDIVKAFKSLPQIPVVYLEIGVKIDSDQGRADVELFLRNRFDEIRERYGAPSEWPSEVDFLKVAKGASGHFAFGKAAIRFIDDEDYANPVSQLGVVITVIESTTPFTLEQNPLAALDNLYFQILLAVPPKVRDIASHLLALSFTDWRFSYCRPFWAHCNWLKLSQADAYGALRKLHSVLRVPPPEQVDWMTRLEPFHKSFSDYIISSARSGQFHVPDPMKILLVGMVRVLSESRDPVGSVVKTSGVQLSWTCMDHTTELQMDLLCKSLFTVTENIDEAISCEDDTARTTDKLAAFFQDLDYADPFTSHDLYLARTLPFWFKSKEAARMISVLEAWGVARPVAISSIKLTCVRADRAANVRGGQHEWEPTAIPHFFTDYDSDKNLQWGKASLSQNPNWQERLQEHLQAIEELELPARVYLIGKGKKSVISIYQNINASTPWSYIIPYDQS